MSARVEALRDLYVEVAGTDTVTDAQEDHGPYEPIEDEATLSEEVSGYVREHGLDGALDSLEVSA